MTTMMNSNWFTEIYPQGGSAFSLAVKEKLYEEQTPFQRIEVYATETFGNLLVIDGCTMLSSLDNFLYHEMMAHPALFTHPDPKRVLIIGGGDCGTLREVLKHPGVEQVVLVDIDERVTQVSQQFFPELCESNNDPRAQLRFDDGIQYLASAESDSFDVIIIDSTDPVGPGAVLVTEAFYRHCYRVLGGHGIMVQQSESPLYDLHTIIQPMYRTLRTAGFMQIRSLSFPTAIYPSGWWSATLASPTMDLDLFRVEDAKRKPFTTQYYNAGIHQGALAMPEFMQCALRG